MSWTQEEKDLLISLYDEHTDKELCDILKKSAGQLRGMKERLHLNYKNCVFTDDEKQLIIAWYQSHPNEMDLSELSSIMGRQKTSISRFACKCGLTNRSRDRTAISIDKWRSSYQEYLNSEYYKSQVLPKHRELLLSYLHNNHPKGMLGKHHTEDVCSRISKAVSERFANMTDEEKKRISDKQRRTRMARKPYSSTEKTHSRGRGGKRDDIGKYFRSSWEANTARVMSFENIRWEFEPKRFIFPDDGSGVLSYCPDFYLASCDMWVEVKGWMDEKSVTRLKKFEKYYPDESRKLVIIGEQEYRKMESIYSPQIPLWEFTKQPGIKGGKANG